MVLTNGAEGQKFTYLYFEIALLDHGLYVDLDNNLRMNYAKLWLAFIAPATPEIIQERRKYAKLVGNIGPDKAYFSFLFAMCCSLNVF